MQEVIEGSVSGQLSIALAIIAFGMLCFFVGIVYARDYLTRAKGSNSSAPPIEPPARVEPLCVYLGCLSAATADSDCCERHRDEMLAAGNVAPKRCAFRPRGGNRMREQCDFFASLGSNYCPMHQPDIIHNLPR